MPQNTEEFLKTYIPIASGIAASFGPFCETVIHDLSHPQTSIIYIANGEVSGRKVGDGLRDLLSDLIRSPNFKDDVLANYESVLENGKRIKSTSIMIRDLDKKIVGTLCINFDVTVLGGMVDFLTVFLNSEKLRGLSDKVLEEQKEDVLDVLEHIMQTTINEEKKGKNDLTRDEMINVLRYLDKKNVFLIKGAIEWAANKLGISRFTVYSYLKEIRTNSTIEKREAPLPD